jgi:hypothetical protein
MNKNIYIYTIIAVIIVAGLVFWMGRNNKADDVTDLSILETLSPSPSQSSTPSQTPKLIKSTPKPSPKLVAKEINSYQSWVDWLEPLNRHLVLDENCTSIVPSQVAYPNNTQIMFDNTLSPTARILKVGSKEYSLNANDWLVVALSSPTLPAQLTMFCGPMELGQIDLQ